MIEHYLRAHYQTYFADALAKIVSSMFSANWITLLACLSGIAIAPLLYYHHSVIAFCALILTGLLDTLDGTVARLNKTSSPMGTLYDIVSDRIVECSIILGLFLYAPTHRALLSLMMLSSILICITCFLVVGIFAENQTHKGFHYSPGLMERFEAFLFFGAMLLLPHYFNALSIVFSALVLWTALHHILQFKRIEKNSTTI